MKPTKSAQKAEDRLDGDTPAVSLSPWASLRYRDYSFLFIASLFVTTAQQMHQTQNLYQVYELSGSAFQLGLTGLIGTWTRDIESTGESWRAQAHDARRPLTPEELVTKWYRDNPQS